MGPLAPAWCLRGGVCMWEDGQCWGAGWGPCGEELRQDWARRAEPGSLPAALPADFLSTRAFLLPL